TIPGQNYNIVLLVDRSGSMTSNDLVELTKGALVNFVESLADHDGIINIALIGFNGSSSTLVLDVQDLTDETETELVDAIEALTFSGGTPYDQGFNQTVTWFNSSAAGPVGSGEHEFQNLTFFLTDGVPSDVGNAH